MLKSNTYSIKAQTEIAQKLWNNFFCDYSDPESYIELMEKAGFDIDEVEIKYNLNINLSTNIKIKDVKEIESKFNDGEEHSILSLNSIKKAMKESQNVDLEGHFYENY